MGTDNREQHDATPLYGSRAAAQVLPREKMPAEGMDPDAAITALDKQSTPMRSASGKPQVC